MASQQPVQAVRHKSTVTITLNKPAKKIPPPVATKPSRSRTLSKNEAIPQGGGSLPADDMSKPRTASTKSNQALADELDQLTDMLTTALDNTDDENFFGICAKCKNKVTGEGQGCTALGSTYHVSCFLCSTCKTTLTGKEFYCVEDETFCESCYLNTLEECAVCAQKISERILRAVGSSFHPHCFKCSVCDKDLDGIPFTVDATNQVHCVECYQQRFSPRCAACQKLILPQNEKGETVHIVSMQKNFHVECYKCEDCGLLLSSEEGRGCYPLDDHLLCQQCNGKRVQQSSSVPTTEL